MVTNIGASLTAAIEAIDTDYDAVAARFSRHVILLTDGAWDDFQENGPRQVIEDYTSTFPSRPFPTVHGISIYDSLTHVRHGYPPQGCSDVNITDLEPLQSIADFTGGNYFSASTPQNIIEAFNIDLCEAVAVIRSLHDGHNRKAVPCHKRGSTGYRLYDLFGREVPTVSNGVTFPNRICILRNGESGRKTLSITVK